MSPTFTDDDVEKRVENAAGDVIGVVTAVEGESVRVEPRSGVMGSIRSAIGWGGTRRDTVYVHERSVAEISADTIRIEGEPLEDETGAEPESASELDTEDLERRAEERKTGLGPAPDEGVGRSEREPGNTDERGGARPSGRVGEGETAESEADQSAREVRPAERAHPSEDVSGPQEPIETRDETDAGQTREADTEEAHELNTDATTAELDAAEEMAPGDDVEEATIDPTEGSENREESGSIPVAEEELEPGEMDLLEDQQHGVGRDSVDDVDEISEMEEVDESQLDAEPGTGEEWESVESDEYEPAEPDEHEPEMTSGFESEALSAYEAESGAVTTYESDSEELPRDAAPGIDAGSLEEVAETDDTAGSSETFPGARRDAADELDVGTDPDALEAAAETDAAADERQPGSETEEMDLVEEFEQGVELESTAATDTGGEPAGEESEPATHRIVSDVEIDATPGAGDEATAAEPTPEDRPVPDVESAAEAALDAQQTAIREGQRAIIRGFRFQQELAHLTIETQAEFGRQSLEQFRSISHAYVDAFSPMTGVGTRRERRRSTGRDDDPQERVADLEAWLEHQTDVLEELHERLEERD